ncbi:coth protein-domain-containing protein [Mucor lusitanicus]
MSPLIALTSIVALTSIAVAQSTNTTYNVVAPVISGQSVGVIVGNQTYPLNRSGACPLIFTGSAPSGQQYQYVKLNNESGVIEKEAFSRSAVSGNVTLNEFYNRTWTTMDVPTLPQVLEPIESLNRNDSGLHVEGQIPTIYLSARNYKLKALEDLSRSDLVSMDMVYITPDQVKEYKKVRVGVYGSTPESRYLPKPSFKLDVSHKNQTLGSYKHLLLRSLASDPSYLREHLASDIARAAGLAVPGFSFARVFVNDQPYGLYGLMEDYKTQFLRNEFGNGSDAYENGILYSGDYNATLDYLGEDQTKYNQSTNDNEVFPNNYYSIQQTADIRQSRTSFRGLIAFTQFLTNTSDTVDNVEPVTAWNRYLETSSFLKSAALEVLLGNTNGYIAAARNYFLYINPNGSHVTFIPSTMENTMGNTAAFNLSDLWSGNVSTYPGFNSQNRPLLDEFLQSDLSNLTNPEIISKRIDALAGLIQEDVYWDSSLPRLNLTNANGSSITAQVLFGNATDLTAIQKDFAGRILNGTVDFEAAVNGTISQQHDSLAGIKEWFGKQYDAFNAVDSPPTATMSVVEPIEPTATPVTEAVAVQKAKANDDDFTRQTSPVSSSLNDTNLPDNFTRQTFPVSMDTSSLPDNFTRQTSPVSMDTSSSPDNFTRQTSPVSMDTPSLPDNFTRQTSPVSFEDDSNESTRQTAPIS